MTISMESSQRDLFIDVVVDRFIFKNNYNTLLPWFTFIHKTGLGLPETGGYFLLCIYLFMKINQGKSVIFLLFKIPLWTTISVESSQRDLFIDMVVDTINLKNKQITLSSVPPWTGLKCDGGEFFWYKTEAACVWGQQAAAAEK